MAVAHYFRNAQANNKVKLLLVVLFTHFGPTTTPRAAAPALVYGQHMGVNKFMTVHLRYQMHDAYIIAWCSEGLNCKDLFLRRRL